MKPRDEYELRSLQWGARSELIEVAQLLRDELSAVRETAYRKKLIKTFDRLAKELSHLSQEIDRLNKLFAKPRKK